MLLRSIGKALAVLCICALVFMALRAHSAEYTRDGGTADFQCCNDKACTSIISQHADSVRAFNACAALTDADGKQRWTRSNAFRVSKAGASVPPVIPVPVTGSATLTWTVPTRNTNGSTLLNIAGYRIVYGQSPSTFTGSLEVANVTTATVPNLTAGTWYFSVMAKDGDGVMSLPTTPASKVIQ